MIFNHFSLEIIIRLQDILRHINITYCTCKGKKKNKYQEILWKTILMSGGALGKMKIDNEIQGWVVIGRHFRHLIHVSIAIKLHPSTLSTIVASLRSHGASPELGTPTTHRCSLPTYWIRLTFTILAAYDRCRRTPRIPEASAPPVATDPDRTVS